MSSVNFNVVQEWGFGFQGQINLTNNIGGVAVKNWTLEFTADFQISSIWNAEIVSHINNRYVIRYASWDPDLSPGKTVNIGFIGIPASKGIAAPTNYTLNGNSLDSPVIVPSLNINDATVTEGNTGITYLIYTVSLSAASTQAIKVDFATANNSAIVGSDYQATSGTLTFAPGETSKTIKVAINGDTTVEAHETFSLNLSNASGATIADAQAQGTITNDDQLPPSPTGGNIAVTFKVDSQWNSGFTGTITLTNKGQTTINGWNLEFDTLFSITSIWNAQKNSSTGGHYQLSDVGWNAKIAPNSSVSFGFNGSWSSGGVPEPTNYKFNGELLGGFLSLSINDVSITEGDNGNATAIFTVNLSGVSQQNITVDYATANGEAIAGLDYTATTGSLTFTPGQTSKTIAVTVKGDTLYEGNERFFLNLSNAKQANLADSQGIATIVDNDPQPPRLTINDVSINEGNSGLTNAIFTLTLSSASNQTVSVGYSTQNGSATVGSDYIANNGVLTFTPGQTSQTIAISIQGDTVTEGNETFTVNLANASNALIGDSQAIGTILNDDSSGGGGNSDYVVAAYYPEWAIYDRNFQVKDIPAQQLTHIFYAFAKIDGNGKVAVFDPWAATQTTFNGKYTWTQSEAGEAGNFAELKALKTANPHLNQMISIGGWTLSGSFSDVALTDASREKFATSAVEFVVKYGFDGIDIDWEYPVSGGLETNVYRPEDKGNYTLLLQELREQLDIQEGKDGKDYQLTIASPAGFDKIANYELGAMSEYLDFFNVMTYDYHGAWERTTNHQAALYSNPNDLSSLRDQYNISSTIDQYLNAGVASQDIVLGVPLYGQSWTGVGNVNNGLFQSATGAGPGTWENGKLDYDDLFAKVNNPNSGYLRYWDDIAKVPYVYNQSLGVFSTYEDVQSLGTKLDYLKEKNLGGMFFWEASADLPVSNSNSLINLAATQLGVV